MTGGRWERKCVCRGGETNEVGAGGFPPTDSSERPKNIGKRWGKERKKYLIFKNSLVLKSLRPAGEVNKF